MRGRNKHNIDIVTVPDGPKFLVSVFNTSYYHSVFSEGNGIVADFLFYFVCHVAEKALVGHRELFGDVLNLLRHIELLIYAKPVSFLVGSTNVYGVIFYQVYLLSWLTIPFFLFSNVK